MPFDTRIWTEFCGELESRVSGLTSELSSAWNDVSALTEVQGGAFATLKDSGPRGDGLQSLNGLFQTAAVRLLTEPLAVYSQKRPLQRSLAALEENESAIGDLLRRLPKAAELSGQDLTSLPGADPRSLVGVWRSWQGKPKAIPLRDATADHIQQLILARAALDGAFQLLLAESSLHLLAPWQTCRRAFLAALTQSEWDRVDVGSARAWWIDAAQRREQRAALLLKQYDTWAQSISAAIAVALLWSPHPAGQSRRAKWTKEHQKHASFWTRQQRAVRAVMDLELHMAQLARDVTAETMASLEAVSAEYTELMAELDTVIAWLRQRPEGEEAALFPQPKASLLSAEERLSGWLRQASGKARAELPVTLETVEPHRGLPGWRKPWRDLEPAKEFQSALAAGAPILLSGFQEAEAAHRAIIREIERAREVVNFGVETARLEPGAGDALAREAVTNALSLLNYKKETTPEIRPVAEASAAHAEAVVLLECDIALEKNRVGLLARVTRQRGGEALRQLGGLARKGVQAGSRRLWGVTRGAYRWALLKIGWIAAPRQPAAPVVQRPDLAETLEVHLRARDLPMIYRRLFRLAPVEDPRFLVGRDAEMAGFSDALQRWESGRGACVIVIGARGSGKTSLVNCAISRVFAGREVIRGQFCERLRTPAQTAGFVRGLLRIPADVELAAGLCERPRVVVVEEFERTFLRTVNGFDALKALLSLMYATGRSTFWVFSVNETAYRYLDAVAGIGRHFSHHINAMSVAQEDLTGAILQRHGLSGLRLEFAPLPEQDPRVSRIRRFLGFEQDPQRLFLEALYEQSEGIFRAAFELWQGSVERVEGGIVHMRQPLTPDYQKLRAEMTLQDCFLLKAILQHGSLTPDELTQVLAMSREESVRQLERLQLLEVLEPEPDGPGVRVRPEAGRLVRETLSHRNLL